MLKKNIGYHTFINKLAQKFPFIMLDQIVELVPSKRIVAIKNISNAEAPFSNNERESKIFPQIYLIEILGQVSQFIMGVDYEERGNYFILLKSADFNFYKEVGWQDHLRIEAELVKIVRLKGQHAIIYTKGKIYRSKELICSGMVKASATRIK